jgi:acyl carrier protein
MEAYASRIISIIARHTEVKLPVTLESNLIEDLSVDSFGTIMIMDAIEDEFSIELQEADFEQLVTVGDVVRLLAERFPQIREGV